MANENSSEKLARMGKRLKDLEQENVDLLEQVKRHQERLERLKEKYRAKGWWPLDH